MNRLAAGTFKKNQMNIYFKSEVSVRKASARDYILKRWCCSVIKNPKLFPGNLVRVTSHKIEDGKIIVKTCHTTYDDYLITRSKAFRNKFPEEKSANPLSVGAIVVTDDDYILMGPRKEQTSQKGRFTLPSGMVDDEDVCKTKVDAFGAIKTRNLGRDRN